MAQYIDKAAVIAEIVGYISNYKEIVVKTDRNDSTWVDSVSMIDAKIDVLQHLLSFLDTLEVKEVDLEEEDVFIEKAIGWIDYNNRNGGCFFDGWEKDFKKYMKGE